MKHVSPEARALVDGVLIHLGVELLPDDDKALVTYRGERSEHQEFAVQGADRQEVERALIASILGHALSAYGVAPHGQGMLIGEPKSGIKAFCWRVSPDFEFFETTEHYDINRDETKITGLKVWRGYARCSAFIVPPKEELHVTGCRCMQCIKERAAAAAFNAL